MTTIEKLTIAAFVALLLAAPCVAVFQAKMESATYNKLTGAQTTWWDALWVELRVQDTPKGAK